MLAAMREILTGNLMTFFILPIFSIHLMKSSERSREWLIYINVYTSVETIIKQIPLLFISI